VVQVEKEEKEEKETIAICFNLARAPIASPSPRQRGAAGAYVAAAEAVKQVVKEEAGGDVSRSGGVRAQRAADVQKWGQGKGV